MGVVGEVWDRAWSSQPASPLWVVVATGAVAACAVLVPAAWRVTEYVATIAHEAGHGVVSVLTGQKVTAVHLRSDRSGQIRSSVGSDTAEIAGLAAGYTGPTLFGLGAAALMANQHTVGLLLVALILLGGLLVYIRTWFGLLILLAAVGLVFCVSWLLPIAVQSAFGHLVAWFLLFAAPRDVLQLHGHWQGADHPSDVDQLVHLTGLPGAVWVWIFLVVTVGAVPLGAYWMLF